MYVVLRCGLKCSNQVLTDSHKNTKLFSARALPWTSIGKLDTTQNFHQMGRDIAAPATFGISFSAPLMFHLTMLFPSFQLTSRQLVPLLTNRDISLIRTGRLYSSCVRSSMLHGSETWPVRKENEVALE